MSGHVDTIRRLQALIDGAVALQQADPEPDHSSTRWKDLRDSLVMTALYEIPELVAENQQQADRIKWLEGEEAGWRTGTLAQTERLGKATAENQQLCGALEQIAAAQPSSHDAGTLAQYLVLVRGQARAALAGTPSEGMVRTEHGWARPCAVCGSTDAGKPCPNTEDGFHVAGTASEGHRMNAVVDPWEKVAVRLKTEKDAYRIEADQAISEYDALEVDAGIMGRALARIAERRRNQSFDPWAVEQAREALSQVSDRVTAILPAATPSEDTE